MPTPPQPQAAPPPRDPALDGLRGLAVLLVFLFHYGGGLHAHNPLLRAFGYVTEAGWIGVEFFFALSGYLITGLLADSLLIPPPPTGDRGTLSPPTKPGAPGPDSGTWVSAPLQNRAPSTATNHPVFRNFYARRALRILPLYLAALLACAAAALLTGATFPQLQPLPIYVAFLQNLPPLLNSALHAPPPLPVFHLWSLAVEEQFYLLWPLALFAARTPRRALGLSLVIFTTSCLFRAILFAPDLFSWATANSFATFLPTRAGALALGSALALYCRLHLETISVPPPVISTAMPPHTVISTEAKRSGETSTVRLWGAKCPSQFLALLTTATALSLILLAALHTHTLLLNTRTAFLVTLPAADLLSVAVVALALHPNLLRSALSTAPFTFLGRISYGFYVLHILLEPLFDRLGTLLTHSHAGFGYQTARLLTALPITTAAATLSFYLLELPFLRRKRRFPRGADPVC